jgi:hypothetical protein
MTSDEEPSSGVTDESATVYLSMTNRELADALDAYVDQHSADQELVDMLMEASNRVRWRAIEQKEKR